ncbi:Uncharacterized protein GBIM_07064 [Gryllus bimaculatus]|nr:Uncharacterized protein GBIM_07064 [Gryllus bimaculatus]
MPERLPELLQYRMCYGAQVGKLEQRLVSLQTAHALRCSTCRPLLSRSQDLEKRLARLLSERSSHLRELAAMKQEALEAAISEKDAHLALLEVSGLRTARQAEQAERLRADRRRLMERLKRETEHSVQLLQQYAPPEPISPAPSPPFGGGGGDGDDEEEADEPAAAERDGAGGAATAASQAAPPRRARVAPRPARALHAVATKRHRCRTTLTRRWSLTAWTPPPAPRRLPPCKQPGRRAGSAETEGNSGGGGGGGEEESEDYGEAVNGASVEQQHRRPSPFALSLSPGAPPTPPDQTKRAGRGRPR